MVERNTKLNEIGYVKLGLISAVTAVNLKIEESPHLQPHYETAKKALDYLVDRKSLIHEIAPAVFERNKEKIEEARETFPEPRSLDILLALLDDYSRL